MKLKIGKDGMTLKFKYEEMSIVLDILGKKAAEQKALEETNKWDICSGFNKIAKEVYENEKKVDEKKEKTINELKKAVAIKNNCKDYEEFEFSRKVVNLHDNEGKSFTEIANILGSTYSKVQRKYHQMKGDKDGGTET